MDENKQEKNMGVNLSIIRLAIEGIEDQFYFLHTHNKKEGMRRVVSILKNTTDVMWVNKEEAWKLKE